MTRQPHPRVQLSLALGVLLMWSASPAEAITPQPASPPGPVTPSQPRAATAPAIPAHHPADAHAHQYEKTGLIAGVEVRLKVHHLNEAEAQAAMHSVFEEIKRVHRKLTAGIRGSEITSLNHIGGREEMIMSSETYDLLTQSLRLCRETGHAYDPTVQSFDYLWNFSRRPFVRPLPDEIRARLALVGCDKMVLKPGRRVRFLNPNLRLTLKGLLHGHALQMASAKLRDAHVTSFRLRIGRELYVQGRDGTRYWYVGVQHPYDPSQTIVQLYLGSQAVATRSHAEHFVMKAGHRYHDQIDPRTGQPAQGLVQATVISTDPLAADALSRAVFVMGAAKGLAYIAKVPNAEAFVVDSKGRVRGSKGMKNFGRLPATISLKTL